MESSARANGANGALQGNSVSRHQVSAPVSNELPDGRAVSTTEGRTPIFMSSESIWEAYDMASFLLQLETLHVGALESVERSVSVLRHELERRVVSFSSVHGAQAPEAQIALESLAAARMDLEWVKTYSHASSDADSRGKLFHALRSCVRGLALLGWSEDFERKGKGNREDVCG
jgi:hypothetical protein